MGRVIEFKLPTSHVQGLKVLYIEDDKVFFRYRRNDIEYHFSRAFDRAEIDEPYAILLDPENEGEVLENEHFEEAHWKCLREVHAESLRVAKEQAESWRHCTFGERLDLQIVWATDIVQDLEKTLQKLVGKGPILDVLDDVKDLLEEISYFDGRLEGLKSARACL